MLDGFSERLYIDEQPVFYKEFVVAPDDDHQVNIVLF